MINRCFWLILSIMREFNVSESREIKTINSGERLQLNCSIKVWQTVSWHHLRNGNKNPFNVSLDQTLSTKYSKSGKYGIVTDKANERYDLIITNVQTNDAGTFYCKENDLLVTEIQLTVIEEVKNLTITPINTLALVADRARFCCSTTNPDPVYWLHRPLDSKNANYIFVGFHGLQGEYKSQGRHTVEVDKATGQYDLVINDVRISDAGAYICVDDAGLGVDASAELIVISDLPSCISNNSTDGVKVDVSNSCGIKPDFIQLSCSVVYVGNAAPVLEIPHTANYTIETRPPQDKPGTKEEKSYLVVQVRNCTTNSSFVFRVKGSPRGKEDYKCLFPEIWKPGVLDTKDLGKIDLSSPNQGNLTCDANINQTCDYKWINEDNIAKKIVISGSTLNSVNASVTPGNYHCTAECNIRGKTCIIRPLKVEILFSNAMESYSTNILVCLLLIGIAIPIIIAVCILYIYRRKRRRHTNYGNNYLVKKEQIKEQVNERGQEAVRGRAVLDQRSTRLLL